MKPGRVATDRAEMASTLGWIYDERFRGTYWRSAAADSGSPRRRMAGMAGKRSQTRSNEASTPESHYSCDRDFIVMRRHLGLFATMMLSHRHVCFPMAWVSNLSTRYATTDGVL